MSLIIGSGGLSLPPSPPMETRGILVFFFSLGIEWNHCWTNSSDTAQKIEGENSPGEQLLFESRQLSISMQASAPQSQVLLAEAVCAPTVQGLAKGIAHAGKLMLPVDTCRAIKGKAWHPEK